AALVKPPGIPSHQAHVAAFIERLERQSRGADQGASARFGMAIDQLWERSTSLAPTDLVPTHGDPNWKNFVLSQTLCLVDWDDAALPDPLRDIGQLMWWYVPPKRWGDFFRAFGLVDDEVSRDGLFWWAA